MIIKYETQAKASKAIAWIMAAPRGVAYLLGAVVGHLIGGLRSGFYDGR